MIVVSNTSPLNYLVLLKKDHVLADLFGKVFAPPSVMKELSSGKSPPAVRAWASNPPRWLTVQAPTTVDPTIDLDVGESEAIALAEELHAERILLDESKARAIAKQRGLKVAGSLAILFDAHEAGLLDFKQTIIALRQTTFYFDEKLIEALISRLSGS